jgi:hypothetical protein
MKVPCSKLPIEIIQAASRDWRLVPVPQPSNHPQLDLASASCDLIDLQTWAHVYPDASWALATGQASGVVALEVDTCARTALQALAGCDADWSDEEPLRVQTSDRMYAFLSLPQELSLRRKRIAPGIRILGDGDSVLLPPSFVSGVPLKYVNPNAAVLKVPKWLLDLAFGKLCTQTRGKVLPFPPPQPRPANSSKSLVDLPRTGIVPFSPRIRSESASQDRHRVHMLFRFRGSWRCQFLTEDMRTALPKTLTFASVDKLVALAERGGGLSTSGSRESLDRAIKTGAGTVVLQRTHEQFSLLMGDNLPALGVGIAFN